MAVIPIQTLSAPEGAYRLLPSVKVPMRDGVNLSTDIYLPSGHGPFPIILVRTPYDKNTLRPNWVSKKTSPFVYDVESTPRTCSCTGPVEVYINAGYAVVTQDFRGVFESEGIFKYAKSERRDFEDTAKWLDAQSWSARRMGMWGCSYLGNAQVVGAVTDTLSLKAITPMAAAGAFSLKIHGGLADVVQPVEMT
ncbi:CocE/NonD family hydrolase [Mesorhizobium sp. M0514]|uniref:CocE/NonD family hydrolase n=1 Tax=Mesorhizobium sp. M0514 TaxID=2956955 RepID=UPI0033352AD8